MLEDRGVRSEESALRWRADLGWIQWSWRDETVVYVESTASTHLLSASASEVLRALVGAASPLTTEEIARMMVGEDLSQPDFDAVLATLDGLRDVGLCECLTA